MSKLRVAGGEARGRRLKTPKGIRPTQGMVKEAMFNLVGPAIGGERVVDLFAGSGAIGIEALSRGAAGVTFVDREPRGLAILRQNLEVLDLKSRAEVVRADVVRWLEGSPEALNGAAFVFMDPPYEDPILDRAIKAIDRGISSAMVVVEHSRRQELPQLTRMRVDRQRRYGDTMVSVLRA
ncbi:MAG TPA: 16S rRNA (guanine(966)-N(2))-methyltransferase RsmD [Candidatus Acidoferrum sp.]|jgi:16S rRNA (guanine966-N2)-methyltransferase|nr:16S rRNA (guanine(966)-N(2))-methyltransferase RsmD [Candidatus Acidoferrum sp.]